jgi:hypothetical protein
MILYVDMSDSISYQGLMDLVSSGSLKVCAGPTAGKASCWVKLDERSEDGEMG